MIFRLSNDVNYILKNNFVVIDVFFFTERVNKIIEKVDEAKESLSTHTQIDVFRQVDKIRKHDM